MKTWKKIVGGLCLCAAVGGCAPSAQDGKNAAAGAPVGLDKGDGEVLHG